MPLSTLPIDLEKAIEHLHNEFAKLQVGRANPAIVEGIMLSAYGSVQPLRNVASVAVMDAQTLSIQPWDKSLIRDIDRAITEANLGLNPQNNGESIMIKIPVLTEERRRDLVKVAKRLAEEAKISTRNVRGDILKKIKAEDGVSEDVIKSNEASLQKSIDAAIKKIDDMLSAKENDIMKI